MFHLERASQLDNDWNVVGNEGREGAPLRIHNYVGGCYCEVGRGGVPEKGDAGRRMEVDEKVVGIYEGFCD